MNYVFSSIFSYKAVQLNYKNNYGKYMYRISQNVFKQCFIGECAFLFSRVLNYK